MSRNRFKDGHSLHWAKVLQYVAGVAVLLIIGLGFLAAKNYQMRLADEALQARKELARINRSNQQLQDNVNCLISPAVLQRRVNDSGMVSVGELAVVRQDAYAKVAKR